MIDKLVSDAAGALLTAHPSRKLIEGIRQERENVRVRMMVLEATARLSRLESEEIALFARRLDAVLPKLEAALERGQRARARKP